MCMAKDVSQTPRRQFSWTCRACFIPPQNYCSHDVANCNSDEYMYCMPGMTIRTDKFSMTCSACFTPPKLVLNHDLDDVATAMIAACHARWRYALIRNRKICVFYAIVHPAQGYSARHADIACVSMRDP
jgi:hypothetical protein